LETNGATTWNQTQLTSRRAQSSETFEDMHLSMLRLHDRNWKPKTLPSDLKPTALTINPIGGQARKSSPRRYDSRLRARLRFRRRHEKVQYSRNLTVRVTTARQLLVQNIVASLRPRAQRTLTWYGFLYLGVASLGSVSCHAVSEWHACLQICMLGCRDCESL
jgi:hypothetical protein